MKVNRKSTPQMVKHKTFASDFQRLEREQHNRERPHDSLGRVPPLTFLPRLSSGDQSPLKLST